MARWRNSLGEEVDVKDIDKEYALNILTLCLLRRGRNGYLVSDLGTDELVQALRETILHGREPNDEDKRRAALYNKENQKAGRKYRAPVEDPADAYPANTRMGETFDSLARADEFFFGVPAPYGDL